MPTMVQGEDGREIAEKLGDQDARDLAAAVHNNTGETLTLTPYKQRGDGYVLDKQNAHYWPRPAPEPTVPSDLADYTVAQLDALLTELGVEVPANAKKADKLKAAKKALKSKGA